MHPPNKGTGVTINNLHYTEKDRAVDRKIVKLMKAPPEERGLQWLTESLQAAIELEFATVPVYLCGMWSIETQSGPVFNSIRSVVIDEMFHMALACNMLTTIGGTPRINNRKSLPRYPGALPGGVRPGLTIALTGLTKQVVEKMYLQIEFPEHGPVAMFLGQVFPTIGDFYDAILEEFKKLSPTEITGSRQVSRGQKLFAITTVADAEKAITRIKRQGEGTEQLQSPFSDEAGTVLAHYYKFAEIFHERRLIRTAAGEFKFEGDPLPFPPVIPMAEVPAGGYPESREFNLQFTTMLNQLQAAWDTGEAVELDNAINTMKMSLTDLARALIATPLPSGNGNFGPTFELLE
jgi:hypothetical protein